MKRYDVRGVLHELRHRWTRRRTMGAPPLAPGAQPKISVVCVSNRPEQLDHIVRMFHAQEWPHKNLVLVVNAADYATDALSTVNEAIVLRTPPTVSLGECLNQGFAAATGEVIARFDDDDYYTSDYLASVVDVFRSVDAQLTGKSEYLAYVESQDQVVRRFPGKSKRYVGRVAGGSLAVVADAVRGVKFPDQNLGEDVVFMRRCERSGLRLWASPAKGFLQMRHADKGHTWDIDDKMFSASADVVGSGRDPALWA